MSLGLLIPSNSVTYLLNPDPHYGMGLVIPDRSVDAHRAVTCFKPPTTSMEVFGHASHRC